MENETKSTHKCEVVPIKLEKHPNADKLSIIPVHGYTYCGNTEEWQGIDLGVFCPPDSVVKISVPEFAFLAPRAKSDGTYRIKAMKLRQVLSFGLLVPARPGWKIGDDVAAELEVTHYDPPIQGAERGGLFLGGEVASAPNLYSVKYDVDAGRRYGKDVFQEGEPVVITEKIHGASAKFTFLDGKMHVSSRSEWKKEYPDYSHITVESLEPKVGLEKAKEIVENLKNKPKVKNAWWQALDRTPSLRKFCENHSGYIVHGEVFGAVQDLPYGRKRGEVDFVAFDIMKDGVWLEPDEFFRKMNEYQVPTVPLLNQMFDGIVPISFSFDKVCEMAEGKTILGNGCHTREGIVVKPIKERYHPSIGRVCLKWVGAGYLERSK